MRILGGVEVVLGGPNGLVYRWCIGGPNGLVYH